MAQIRHMTQTYNSNIRKFLGVNESPSGENSLKSGEGESMTNYRITLDGKLELRPGALQLRKNVVYAVWNGLHRNGNHLSVRVGDGMEEVDLAGKLLAIPSCWADVDGLQTVFVNNYPWEVTGTVSAAKGEPLYFAPGTGEETLVQVPSPAMSSYPAQMAGTSPVQCVWTGYLKGEEVFLAASADGLYQIKTGNGGGDYTVTRVGSIGAGGATSMFGFQDKVWILNGAEYWCWDGENAPAQVEGYVPLVLTAAAPSGGGTELEGLNMLSDRYRAQYSPDGESDAFYLPQEGTPGVVSVTLNGETLARNTYCMDTQYNRVIFLKTPQAGINTMEITCYMPLKKSGRVTTEDMTSTATGTVAAGNKPTGYAYSATFSLGSLSAETLVGLGALHLEHLVPYWTETTLAYAYAADTDNGLLYVYYNTEAGEKPDSAVIYGYLPGSLDVQRDAVEKMKYAVLFNGNTDGRVFLYGDGSYTCIYSGLDENGVPRGDYFPALNQANIGSANSPVRSMVRHYNALLAFKPDEAYRITYDVESLADGRAIAGFHIRPVHSAIGSAGWNQAALVYNNPRTLHQGSVFEWRLSYYTSSSNRDERNAKRISDRVKATLSKMKLGDCVVFDDEVEYEYWISDGRYCVVNNYAVDAWYIYEGLAPTSMARFRGDLFLGRSDGGLDILRRGACMDGWPNSWNSIGAEWHGGLFDGGHDYLSKWTVDQYVGLQNLDGNSAVVGLETDRTVQLPERTAQARRTEGSDHLWGAATATVHHIKRRAKGWAYLRTVLKSAAGLPSTVISLDINYRLGTGGRRK